MLIRAIGVCVFTVTAENELARDLNLGLWVRGVMLFLLNRGM